MAIQCISYLILTNSCFLGATLTDMDEDGEKLADITLVQPQDDHHGQHVIHH